MAVNESRVQERYGRLPSSDQQALSYLKALKVIVGADGEIPEAELNALRKGMQRLGISDAVAKEVEAFDFKTGRLEDLLPGIKKGGLRARMLLRDAIEISRADGTYADAEKAAVAKAAGLIGVDQDTVKSLEALVELEHAAKHLRKALFPKKTG
jgi:uncharacterized tellurite resistance protein B-like protein